MKTILLVFAFLALSTVASATTSISACPGDISGSPDTYLVTAAMTVSGTTPCLQIHGLSSGATFLIDCQGNTITVANGVTNSNVFFFSSNSNVNIEYTNCQFIGPNSFNTFALSINLNNNSGGYIRSSYNHYTSANSAHNTVSGLGVNYTPNFISYHDTFYEAQISSNHMDSPIFDSGYYDFRNLVGANGTGSCCVNAGINVREGNHVSVTNNQILGSTAYNILDDGLNLECTTVGYCNNYFVSGNTFDSAFDCGTEIYGVFAGMKYTNNVSYNAFFNLCSYDGYGGVDLDSSLIWNNTAHSRIPGGGFSGNGIFRIDGDTTGGTSPWSISGVSPYFTNNSIVGNTLVVDHVGDVLSVSEIGNGSGEYTTATNNTIGGNNFGYNGSTMIAINDGTPWDFIDAGTNLCSGVYPSTVTYVYYLTCH